MRIGIDIRTLMDARYSGVSEYSYSLIDNILKIDKGNDYCLFYNSFHDVSANISDFSADNHKIIKYKLPNKILNYALFKPFNWPKIDERLKLDLFFMPHINFVGLSGKKPSILTIHDLSYLRYPEYFSTRKNLWHRLIDVRSLIKKFDHIVAVSENTKNDVIELCGAKDEKVSVIHSGADSSFKPLDGGLDQESKRLNEVKQKYNLPEKFILYLGTIEPRKNISNLIKAFVSLYEQEENKGYELILAGMKGWKSDEIYETWRASKQKEQIKFIGYVDRMDKCALYNLAKIFVYPSFYEGFGFPVLESMASGTPVICSAGSSLGEIMGNAAIAIDPNNYEDIKEAIRVLLSDDGLYNELKIRGFLQAKKFDWKVTARKYLDLFESVGH